MAEITRLVAVKGRVQEVKVYLDGKYAFSLDPIVVLEAGLRLKSELSPEQQTRLKVRNTLQKAYHASEHFISYRPRSEYEVRQNLVRKGFDNEIVAQTIDRLRGNGLVDDVAFARYWTENRVAFSPRGRRLVQTELRQKGINVEVLEDATVELDDAESAFLAGTKKANLLRGHSYEEFSRKLGDYLQRRGYDYDVIRSSIKRLWQDVAEKE
ncbi:MAG: RecX family transcriptional regulator [Dehalococcoidia bacterium]|nr:RecX family transcriptional regulator [Dehalococcoidia bacterium]